MQPHIATCLVINFNLAVVLFQVSNISSERATIPKGRVIADVTALKARHVDLYVFLTPLNCLASLSTSDVGSAPQAAIVAEKMKNSDKSLVS